MSMLNSSIHTKTLLALCEGIDTPESLGVWLRLKYAPKELTSLKSNPRDYLVPDRFETTYLVREWVRKDPSYAGFVDTEAVAYAGFAASEDRCRLTNKAFRRLREVGFHPLLNRIFHAAQVKISNVLGSVENFDIFGKAGIGPGATATLSRSNAYPDDKMASIPLSVASHTLPFARALIHKSPAWCAAILGQYAEGDFCFLPHVFCESYARLTTVPKSASTDRLIAVEPTLNLFFQKGIGGHIRRRLRLFGVDLNDQTVNQGLAQRALSESLSTLDLESASDTISTELVYELLPLDWVFLLDRFRSKGFLHPDGSVTKVEKFSAMGNGFTFELESLIFWGLSQACLDIRAAGARAAVYGDDIIIPQSCAHLVKAVLRSCGFVINSRKSFTRGVFFESCGKHYFDGIDVTPSYQKEHITVEKPETLIRAHNRLVRWGTKVTSSYIDHRVLKALRVLRKSWPIKKGTPLAQIDSVGDDAYLSFCPNFYRYRFSNRDRIPGNPQALYVLWLVNPVKGERSITEKSPLWEDRSDDVQKRVGGSYQLVRD